MKKSKATLEKPIYNCHIHTFTFWNTPLAFPVLFILDSETGRLSCKRILVFLIALSVTCLIFLLAGPLVRTVLVQIKDLLQIPLPQAFQMFLSFLKQPPSIRFVPETRFSSLILLVLKDSIVLLLILIVLQFITKKTIGLLKLLFELGRSPNKLRRLAVKGHYLQRNITKTFRLLPIFSFLTYINPAPNDVFERFARFLNTAFLGSQLNVFREIRDQYPKGTKFIILPMNMEHLGPLLGPVYKKIDQQHAELLRLTRNINGKRDTEDKIIYPFYTVHPDQENLDKVVKKMDDGWIFGSNKFRGLKIYPNLGYRPNDKRLMRIYSICQRQDVNVPVMSHCTPKGIWKFGLSVVDRRGFGDPENYEEILAKNKNLRLCLAHFGGAVEWIKHLKGRSRTDEDREAAWVRKIYDMIKDGKYPNLYTDISYTAFTPRVLGLYIDLVDYLKILLSHPLVRKRVLFGSDYYMVEQEKISEKELSILLRSRLGEELYQQISYTNPREFLGIETTEGVDYEKVEIYE